MLFDTYQLVHSLTKAEKRYFQLSASLHVIGEKNNYLKLFEALNRQKKFDKTSISQEFKAQHLHLLKRHLQTTLLKSLRSFHATSSVAIQVYTMISETEILYKKGLTKSALKLVHHAKKIAAGNDLHLAMAQLLELEIKLLAISHQLVHAQPKIKRAFEEAYRQIKLYENFQNCFHFRMEVNAAHNKEILFRQPEDQKKYLEEIKTLSKKDLSEKAKWELYNGAGTYFSSIGDHEEGHDYHKKASAIFEKKTFQASDELRQYVLSLYTQSITFFYLKKYNDALNNLKIIQDLFYTLRDPANKRNIQELFLHSLLLEGFIGMDSNKYEKARPVILQMKKESNERGIINVSLRNEIYYQQTGFWFCTGNFSEARSWLTKMLQDKDAPKENPARYRFARLMQLLVLFELNEFREIENLLPATKKFLRKKDQRFKVEEAVLNFISEYSRSKELRSEKNRRINFSGLNKLLLRVAKDKSEAAALRVFDYAAWARAKAENKTMAELLSKK